MIRWALFPSLARVGTDSGFGTIVAVNGGVREKRPQDSHGVRGDVATSDVASVDTVKDLPAVPSQIRIAQDDFVDFLFDRVADGSIVFSADFETVSDLFDVADGVPRRSRTGGVRLQGRNSHQFEFMPSQFVPEKPCSTLLVIRSEGRSRRPLPTRRGARPLQV